MADLFQSIADIFNNIAFTLTSCVDYITSGVSSLLSYGAVFPSIWSVVSGSYTTVIIGIISVSLGASLLMALLKR